ncbi:YkoF family thiamine/hydroxymethylpyrimidine-binding protein [Occultella aeris]|uniref:HMP/thiamine-binding protein YkoF n=1 Tax=Occultella aeris TaxID=2761496 RepID=A0A7M4DII5_9MICO|nr:YkoF family thiamine/hydroxymethylpyrimidine-binding protein [Occultella aeris]VZO36758.1 Putative HMP/thiamine-binding protein YkoF [Occultella aeris]
MPEVTSPTTSPAPATTTADAAPAPGEYGVGARFTLLPLTDRFVEVITDALAVDRPAGLEVVTDDVSTFVRGTESDVVGYLTAVIARAGRTGVHTVAQVLLSRGCPGEVACEVADGVAFAPERLAPIPATGLRAAAHWSLYPLHDGPDGDHMSAIYAAIDDARERGTLTRSEHFATRLDGDLADVLTTIGDAWLTVGRSVRHVATHATISLNSPSNSSAAGDR